MNKNNINVFDRIPQGFSRASLWELKGQIGRTSDTFSVHMDNVYEEIVTEPFRLIILWYVK